MKDWSNLAKIVYKRTYAREDNGKVENWEDTVERVINGNVKGHNVSKDEIDKLRYLMLNRKAMPAGRGLWFSGAPAHESLGGAALTNCWFFTLDEWENFVLAQDLLCLGGGVGGSIEHKYVSKLPKIKKDITIIHKNTKDADFIVPDSRTGWNELTYRVLESFFVTGKSFTFSTLCLRGKGEPIKGFGGKSSGPLPLVRFIEKITAILITRSGKHLRPVDAMDLMCCIGEMVVAGNVRRSAILIQGDPWDKEYLVAKRWDLAQIPTERAMANLSVVCDDIDDLHPLFWKTYEAGEPFGLVNRTNMRKYGRMGEKKKDDAVGFNPCVIGSTPILTRQGYLNIEDLVDKQIDIWNGFEWSNVTPKITGYNKPILDISFNNGRILSCTENHKFVISTDYTGGYKRIEAKDLEPGMKLIKHNLPIIEEGETFKNAYTQGFISAEGMDGYNYLYLYDPKSMCLDRISKKSYKYDEKGKRYRVVFNFTPLPKVFVPFNWDLKSKLDWLSGLFDGDGCELKEGGLQLVSVDLKFLSELQLLLTTLGVNSKVTHGQNAGYRELPNHKNGNSLYFCQEAKRICIGAKQMQLLKNLGLSCERLKFDKNPQRDASQFVMVTDISEGKTADIVYCFTEEKRHLGCFNGIITGQCGEATLQSGEPCNLQEIFLPNISDEKEFIEAARLMHRYGKRVTCEKYHNEINDRMVKKNRRVGTGITGCLQSPLFNPETLDRVYKEIQLENSEYSKELGIVDSLRTTVVKPSGTLSLLGEVTPGIHPAYSQHYIRRVRFSSDDQLLSLLKESGHHIEPVWKFDGSLDHTTSVVDFYCKTPEGTPVADKDWDTFKQLDVLLMAQKYWSDQAVSVTVYYKKNEIEEIKSWLKLNLKNIKSISFLCHNDHGFKQAPYEAITEEEYNKLSIIPKPIDFDKIGLSKDELTDLECEGGVCPVK